jgi:hypothetical protein
VEWLLSSAAACEIGKVRWWLGPGISPARARPVLEDALRQLETGAVDLKRGRRKQMYRLTLAGEERAYLLKVNRYERGAGGIRRLRRPQPFAAGEARAGGRLNSCYLLIPVLKGVRDLKDLWFRDGVRRAEHSAWATALGQLSRRLHDAGLLQADFAPNNFLFRPGDPPQLLPVDFERARIRRDLGAGARGRMLAKLDRHLAGASATDRMRFLRAYAGGDRRAARRWWRHLTSVAARLAARDLARLRRTSTAAGRRMQCVAWNEWSGWARADAPEPERARAEARTAGPDAARPPDTVGILVEPDAGLWRGSGGASRAAARSLWAAGHMLWARGLAPRPVACVTRDGELRFWLARDPTSRTLLQCSDSEEARRAAIVLVDRLLALGRLDSWLSTRKIALVRRVDGGLGAQLIDASAFRAARPIRRKRRERARALVGRKLREVEQMLEIVRESSS